MINQEKINVLFCLDDITGDYTRHCAVTLLSLLETNKKNKIKIWILSSILPKENIDELKRITALYNQEIEFIIRDDIVPKELKKIIINKNNLTWGVRYRRFFTKFIKGINRILSIDCDVLVMGDISKIYNMDMHGKAIAGYYDMLPFRCKDRIFGINNYINAGVILFDANKYNSNKINPTTMKVINKKYSKYFHGSDQDKINIIFKDDITLGPKEMNYLITDKWFNKGLEKAIIVHCLEKPYIQHSNIKKTLVKQYYKYLNMTKRKGFPEKKDNLCHFKYIISHIREFIFRLTIQVFGENFMKKIIEIKRKIFGL